MTDDIDKGTVTRCPYIRDHQTVAGMFLGADAPQSYSQHYLAFSKDSFYVPYYALLMHTCQW
jgi:hypothetical protein